MGPTCRCPGVPPTGQAVTIGGTPARLPGMHPPPGTGFPVDLAVTIYDGTVFVIASQDTTGTAAAQPAGRAPSIHSWPVKGGSGESWPGRRERASPPGTPDSH